MKKASKAMQMQWYTYVYPYDADKPVCLILDTVKGKGVSFMEHPSWHCKVPTDEEYEIAMKELGV